METPGSSVSSKVKVAIVGGGCASLAAAFELTRPENQGQYEVTVYQLGWRLGGKGASGRGKADRIEEHGLHLWMGFYENAFGMMRECYAERRRIFPNARFADWQDAFKPAPDVGVADLNGKSWEFWRAHFGPGDGNPGDPTDHGPFTVRAYVRQSILLVGELLRSAGSGDPQQPQPQSVFSALGADRLASLADTLLRYGTLSTTAAILEALELLRQAIETLVPGPLGPVSVGPVSLAMQLLSALAAGVRRQLDLLTEKDAELRRVWQVIDLILAIVRGSLREGLAMDPRGYDAINDVDWREWLRRHGASESSLQSGFMRGIYDLAFAFEDGDVTRPRLAAGVALRGALRMFFTYRGSLFWRMSAGMGDIVFAPLYQVLRDRGVRFEFFHRLRNVCLSRSETPFVSALEFDVQARVKGGGEYLPLIDVHHVPSWPASPLFDQLEHGDQFANEGRDFEAAWDRRRAETKTLQVGHDFDFVVLGVSIGALPEVASELIEHSPRWRDMVKHVKTVPTQAFQVWMKPGVDELGWPHGPVNLAGFVEPFDTWADMTHLLPEESWPEKVRSIAYFCSVLPDPGLAVTEDLHRKQRETVRKNAVQFLSRDVRALWPQSSDAAGEFRWRDLAAADPSQKAAKSRGAGRFASQFWTANINPTDRYVQSLPGSIAYRISPLDMTFDNLTIAGDWTATGLDTGCIESAVISGRLAAHALSGLPALEKIVGYDHP